MRQRHATAVRRCPLTIVRTVLIAAVAVAGFGSVASVGGASRVLAHTDVVFTMPAADETVAEPVGTITVAFADPVTLVGAGFEVFTPQEQIVQPVVVTEDDTEFLLQLDPPLAGGIVGVRYEVVAADGHIIDGAFTFTVTAPVPVTAPPTTAAPRSPAPVSPAPVTSTPTSAGPLVTSAPGPSNASVTTASATTTAPEVVAPPPTTIPDEAGSDGGSTGLVLGIVLAAVAAVAAVVVLRIRLRSPA